MEGQLERQLIKQKTSVIVMICIVVMIGMIGFTYSFFVAEISSESGEITGEVESINLQLDVKKMAPATPNSNKKLVPQLDSAITKAVVGTQGSCVDDNINAVCQVYRITVKNVGGTSVLVDGSLQLNANNNPNLKWARISGDGTVSEPTLLSEINTHEEIELTSNELYQGRQTKYYYIVVWISETGYAQMDKGAFTGTVTFSTSSETSENEDYSGANEPKLVNGLIPVYYNDEEDVWMTTDQANEETIWYNYSRKKWANAILVDSSVRDSYMTPETEVDMTKVLAFYVWIPRYKYRVWNINKVAGTDTYNAFTTGIDIIFESGQETSGTITCNDYDFEITEGNGLSESCSDIPSGNGYYTHPAFNFGGENVTGFWMAKFEISNTTSLIKSVPNAKTLANFDVSTLWRSIYNMQSSSNSYGLSTDRTDIDSHMITNMEWGAVAYLTHSDYGRCSSGSCTEVSKNNSLEYYAGKSSGEPGGGSEPDTATGTYTYEQLQGQLASTTGNIYGIYDMSGGATEYVMGSLGTSEAAGTNFAYYANNAGSNYSYTGYEKYLTTYSYGVESANQTALNRTRLGDATAELATTNFLCWYNDMLYIPYSSFNWYTRGGFSSLTDGVGIFLVAYNKGTRVASYTTRPILMGFEEIQPSE